MASCLFQLSDHPLCSEWMGLWHIPPYAILPPPLPQLSIKMKRVNRFIWTHQLPVPLSNQLQVSSRSCVLIVLPCLCYRPASAGWPEKLMPPHILFHHT